MDEKEEKKEKINYLTILITRGVILKMSKGENKLHGLPDEIIVIGDIHGQIKKLRRILLKKTIIRNTSDGRWQASEDIKAGRKHVILTGDLLHGEKSYPGEKPQLDILRNLISLQKDINGLSPNGKINCYGPLTVTLGNHEEAELIRIEVGQTWIHKGSVHQGLAPKGVYYLSDSIKEWLSNLPTSYQFAGFDFAHAGPFDGVDSRGLNKRLWDRSWYNDIRGVKEEYAKKNIIFGFYGHTAYGEDQDSGLEGSAGNIRLAAGGQAAIIDANRYVTGFIEIVRRDHEWVIYKNIDGHRQKFIKIKRG